MKNAIAPCGMNCGICYGQFREKNKCPGCRSLNTGQPEYCRKCRILNCEELKGKKSKYCFNCRKYPCQRLINLDKRYRNRYGMSMIENLETIRSIGVRNFIKLEKSRWTCPECSNSLCVHRKYCSCGYSRPDPSGYFYSEFHNLHSVPGVIKITLKK